MNDSDKIDRVKTTAITLAPEITRNPVATYLLSLQSKESQRTQMNALRYVTGLLFAGASGDPATVPWASVTYAHALVVRNLLAERLAPATAQRYYAAFKGVMREAWRLRLLPTEEWDRIRDVKGPTGSTAEKGRALSSTEIRALFESCNLTGYLGWRDAAVIAASIFGGLRRFEVIGLTRSSYDRNTGELRVLGKGNKERLVTLAPLARHYLDGWIAKHRGESAGPLIYSRGKGKPLGYSTVDAILMRHANLAGIARFTPHDMRRTFVTRILDATGDLSAARKAAGHEKVETTIRYDKRADRAAQAATSKLDEGV